MSETETKEYECKKCHGKFIGLDVFRGHNLKCQVITKEEPTPEPEVQPVRSETREREVSARAERVPLGVVRRRLSFANQDPNYMYRWMNDKETRITDAKAGGYEFVTQEQGRAGEDPIIEQGGDSRISKIVGTNEDGSGRRAYLMRIKKEWYDADQKTKQKYLDNIEEQLQRGVDSQGRPGQDGRYIPKAGGTQITKGE